jgi:anti-sigma B factor antagonist
LDLATASVLDQALRAAHARAPEVTLDLRALTFMDCSSLAVLVAAADRARASAGRFLVVRGPPRVNRLFRLTGIDRRLDMGP